MLLYIFSRLKLNNASKTKPKLIFHNGMPI